MLFAFPPFLSFFFFNDPATTEIYTLSLHDALPISGPVEDRGRPDGAAARAAGAGRAAAPSDRKSTRLNSSHVAISYAVFCLKKKKKATSYPASCSQHSSISSYRSARPLSQSATPPC